MKVLVTGPESSGTRWLTEMLTAAGADALHRSQPEGVDWIDLAAMAEDFDAVIVIVRGLHSNLESLYERIGPPEGPARRRRRALAALAPILGHDRTHLVTYESMASPVERRHLLAELGLDIDAVAFDDASAHRYAGQLVPPGWKVRWDGEIPTLVEAERHDGP